MATAQSGNEPMATTNCFAEAMNSFGADGSQPSEATVGAVAQQSTDVWGYQAFQCFPTKYVSYSFHYSFHCSFYYSFYTEI